MTIRAMGIALALACVVPLAVGTPVAVAQEQPLTAEQKAFVARIEKLLAEVKPQTGDIPIVDARATLHLGEDYYFLGPEDSRRVLVDAWNNPPAVADGVLGIVFAKGTTFADPDAWGAVVTFEKTGYVSDEDARTVDYAELMQRMQESQEAANESRKADGYPALHLVGWAQEPSYDPAAHSVVWAKALRSEGSARDGLNYDIRLLGRLGVLSLNMLSSMDQLARVRPAAAQLAQAATFDSGARYADYVPDVDEKAGYGIAGLVAGGAAVAVAKKAGLVAIMLGVGKKLIVFLVAGVAGLFVALRKRFGDRSAEDDAA